MRSAPLAVAAVAATGGSLLLSSVVGRVSAAGLWGDVLVVPKAGVWALAVAIVVLLIVAIAAVSLLFRNVRFGRSIACAVGLVALFASVARFIAAAPARALTDVCLTRCDEISYAHGDGIWAFVATVSDGPLTDEYRVVAICRSGFGPMPAPVLGPAFPWNDAPFKHWFDGRHVHSGTDVIRTKSGIYAARALDVWSLIWDSRTGRVLWDDDHQDALLCVLLDPGVVPEPRDVEWAAETATRRRAALSGGSSSDSTPAPDEAGILAAMNDGRTSLQEAARTIALAGGPELYPRATALFAASRPK